MHHSCHILTSTYIRNSTTWYYILSHTTLSICYHFHFARRTSFIFFSANFYLNSSCLTYSKDSNFKWNAQGRWHLFLNEAREQASSAYNWRKRAWSRGNRFKNSASAGCLACSRATRRPMQLGHTEQVGECSEKCSENDSGGHRHSGAGGSSALSSGWYRHPVKS